MFIRGSGTFGMNFSSGMSALEADLPFLFDIYPLLALIPEPMFYCLVSSTKAFYQQAEGETVVCVTKKLVFVTSDCC